MMQIQRFNKVLKGAVILGDIIILNTLFISFYLIWKELFGESFLGGTLPQILTLLSVCYFACTISGGVILHRRGVRADQIVLRVLRNIFYFSLLSICMIALSEFYILPKRFFIYYLILLTICLTFYRLFFRFCIQFYRCRGGNFRTVLYLGSTENIAALYHEMSSDKTSGYRVLGYFDTAPNAKFPASCTYLGELKDVIDYLSHHTVNQLYCCLPSSMSECIVPVINHCENHLIHFYNVPNVRNYLRHRMHFEMIGSVPILCIRKEPLEKIENRLAKRTFDVICTLIFLCTLFPIIFIIVGIGIKITSPGPIIFKQKRNGLNNKEFWCYKFRSMKVNKESDILQATANDPRKTKFGDFIRRTNIDELPQFINVLLGDMSIVGPRPHMLKHTEEYSCIINKYMVRHFVKPGITGWAQVTGFRGETRELEDMEGRVKADIWYIEHWSFLLDLYIIYRTIANTIRKDKKAY
ncbi:undecaprenyl-phosphate glucose phosphotransferase [Phocaeicola sp.]